MTRSGIINIYKEQGMTSHDVVGKVRRIVGEKRVGHTGTLDPMATGVLPICVGRSARVIQYLDPDRKAYRCVMKLGKRSDTYDAWGSFVEEAGDAEINAVDEEKVRDVFSRFKGDMEQMPPFYSAVKVNGRRLYEYARKGKAIDMADVPARKIHIYSLSVEGMELGRGSESTVSFSVECSRGTFIRSICDEAGEALGTHGYMCSLERT
ncbi:MAG: tRNA pseudouridine(55) synthase TruB, partial [Anaerovoracaceae bacterium]